MTTTAVECPPDADEFDTTVSELAASMNQTYDTASFLVNALSAMKKVRRVGYRFGTRGRPVTLWRFPRALTLEFAPACTTQEQPV